MIPLVEMAARIPWRPSGLKPLAAVKLPEWKLEKDNTRITRSGTATFHEVATLLVRDSSRIPRKLMAVSSAISKTATTKPLVVSTSVCALSQLCAKDQCWAYVIIADTSIGATVAAWSQENQPNDAPAAPPNA